MRLILRLVAALAWGLWFGGMIALVIFVTRLFGTSRETGMTAAPVLFRTFAVYQLIVGSIAVLATLALWALHRGRALLAATVLLMLSLGAAVPIRSMTMRVDALREAGQSQSDEFKALHKRSERVYSASAVALLIAGACLAGSAPRRREVMPLSAPAAV